jgi:hypothetical protein
VFDSVVKKQAQVEEFILDGEMILWNRLTKTFEEFGWLQSGFNAARSAPGVVGQDGPQITRNTFVKGTFTNGTDGRMEISDSLKWVDVEIWYVTLASPENNSDSM